MPSVQPDTLFFDVSDEDIDQAIAVFGGDQRAAIRALMLTQAWLEGQLSRERANASAGYMRRPSPAPERQ